MMRFLPVAVVVALVAAAVAVVAIGGADEVDGSGGFAGNSGPVEISGVSSRDRRIAADLRAYVAPCPGVADEIASRVRQAAQPGSLMPWSRAGRQLNREYGGLGGYIEYLQRTCGSLQRIAVNDGVITVKTTLESTDIRNAAEFCSWIQGADVADSTPGHTVVGAGAEVLARCRPRTA